MDDLILADPCKGWNHQPEYLAPVIPLHLSDSVISGFYPRTKQINISIIKKSHLSDQRIFIFLGHRGSFHSPHELLHVCRGMAN